MTTTPILVLFRNDLRISDHPALHAAAATGRPVVGLLVYDDSMTHAIGGARQWWLHHSLTKLQSDLHDTYGVQLVLRKGDEYDTVAEVAAEIGADDIYFHRRYYHAERAVDEKLKENFSATDFNGNLLFEPWEIAPATSNSHFYKVFTPFWKACLAKGGIAAPLPAPEKIAPYKKMKSDDLADWNLLPSNPDWSIEFDWNVGEAGAQKRLDDFVSAGLDGYKELRNRPDLPHTSALSPHLAHGEISPRQIYQVAENARGHAPDKDIDHFLSEIGWREFSYNLLYHLEDLPTKMLREEFNDFPWADDNDALQKWQRGQTGYPIVDAGMRELYATGWMHNRVRMIVASFLVKHLLIHWLEGEKWFWDCLVDGDLASNSASWQWVSGCGADAAPYFRIFNPITQGTKFDPEGTYTKKWVPELKDVPLQHLFSPWEMSPMELTCAGVTLGEDYPHPIVNHSDARGKALSAYEKIKKSSS